MAMSTRKFKDKGKIEHPFTKRNPPKCNQEKNVGHFTCHYYKKAYNYYKKGKMNKNCTPPDDRRKP